MAERDSRVQAFLDGKPKRLFIGGQWEEAASGKTFATTNPGYPLGDGEELARGAEGDAADIDRAVKAAGTGYRVPSG